LPVESYSTLAPFVVVGSGSILSQFSWTMSLGSTSAENPVGAKVAEKDFPELG